jgi:hypothetical protein
MTTERTKRDWEMATCDCFNRLTHDGDEPDCFLSLLAFTPTLNIFVSNRLPSAFREVCDLHAYLTSKPSSLRHALCASISFVQFASPFSTTQASRTLRVSAASHTQSR